ncbi:MAG: hypothetical protein AUK63_951 [bacterium P3]|nr:MAG: hypothetical protein AUK64_1108 [bacterium P201]KWW30505.1 MAG: hypothetical protein AUK63_951 [bacterium P3]KWW41392.1 MAG: hypothetical protein F083_1139 [bacterium F083]
MNKFLQRLIDIWEIFAGEVRYVFHDGGVLLLFFVATLLYPFIFAAVYHSEMVLDIPVAVVDQSHSAESVRVIRKIDATPELTVRYKCCTMDEAERLMREHRVHAVILFPRDYGARIARVETARACLFCDMSTFLYYRSVMTGASNVLVDEMKYIELQRCEQMGLTEADAEGQVTPIGYEDVKLFNAPGGFTSFLVPPLLVLVIHQTLFLGIGVLFGTARERQHRQRIPIRLRRGAPIRIMVGRALAYLLMYVPVVFIDLFVLPRVFGFPHIGSIGTLIGFLLPFLLATIFFSITMAGFFRERDTIIVTCIFFSVILLFLSGTAWPQSNMPAVWRWFSYLFPSTPAIQGFIRINTMGAHLSEVSFEYLLLWFQTGVYFFTACTSLRLMSWLRRKQII